MLTLIVVLVEAIPFSAVFSSFCTSSMYLLSSLFRSDSFSVFLKSSFLRILPGLGKHNLSRYWTTWPY